MTNKDHHFWVVLLFFSGVCILGYGCATTPKTDDQSSSDDENKTSLFLPSGSFDESEGSGVFDKSENDRRRRDPGESGSNSEETALPDPSIHQLTDTSEESDPVAPLEDGNLDPLPSAEIEREEKPPAFPESGPRDEEAVQSDSRSPFNHDAEGEEVSDSIHTPKPPILAHEEEDSQSNSPASTTVPVEDEGEGSQSRDASISSPNLAKPSDPSKPLFPALSETGKPSDTFGIRSTDENPANSSFNDSDTGPDSVLKKGSPTEVSPTPSLPMSASPQWSQKVAGENELPPAFSDGVGEGSDSSDDTAAKAIGFSDSLPRTTIPSQGLPPQVGFRDNRISSGRNAPDGLKVALFGEGEVVVPPPRSGSTPSVRFFDRMNLGGNRSEGGNAKILGFSDRRPNSRFLRRGTESSSKNVFQPSGKPNDYNSLKNFLSNRNKLDTGGTGGIPSTGNYPEAEKFLESIDSSKSDESSALREDGTSPDDTRYQNALEWLRSRGQGVELQN